MAIRLILVDDEPVARLGIRARLRKHADFEIVAEASSASEALEKILSLQPDAIFLDIEMLASSGLSLARTLQGPNRPLIVFLTAHRQYALQAFEVEAIDYLLKPVNDIRFEQTLKRLREAVSSRSIPQLQQQLPSINAEAFSEPAASLARIAVSDKKKTLLIDPADIDWVAAAGDYSKLHVHGRNHLLREPLSALIKRLPPDRFLRVHRSTIINLKRISTFVALRNQDILITLHDGTILRASRSFSSQLKAALKQK